MRPLRKLLLRSPVPARVLAACVASLCAAILYTGSAYSYHVFRGGSLHAELPGTPAGQDLQPPGNATRLLLIATYSSPDDHSRRSLVRDTTLRYGRGIPGSPVDHIFVIGQAPDAASSGIRAVLESEQSVHHDLMEVECEENCLKQGKTYEMFVLLSQTVRPACPRCPR